MRGRFPRARFALAASFLGLLLAPVAPASADEADCAGTYLAQGSWMLVDVEPRFVPPPLRAFPWDCASRLADRPFRDGPVAAADYVVLYTDVGFDEVIAIVRSFEQAGWIDEGAISAIDLAGQDPEQGVALTSEDLAALGGEAEFMRARFSDANTGEDIIALTYADGVDYVNDPALTTPSLLVELLVGRTFDAAGIADPSVLSTLRTIDQAAPSPTQTGVIAASAVMLALIVGWPGSLLSSTVSSRYEQLFGWVNKRAPARIRAALKKDQPRALVWVGFVAAAVVAGFVDPAFGINPMSARMLVTGFLGFLVFNLLGWSIVKAVVHRLQPDARPVINFRWGSLLIVAAAVLVARLLQFNPGVIFGLVAGLTFAIALASSRKAIVVLVGSGFALAAALVGWVAYSLVAPAAAASGDNFALVFLTEFFSGVTIEGISTLPIALLPFAVMDGGDLITWKKWVWGIAYTIGIAAFMLVLVTIPDSWKAIPGDFVRWIALFTVFGVLAVIVWALNNWLLQRKQKRKETQPA